MWRVGVSSTMFLGCGIMVGSAITSSTGSVMTGFLIGFLLMLSSFGITILWIELTR